MKTVNPLPQIISLPREGRILPERYWLARMANTAKPAGEILGIKLWQIDPRDMRPGFSGVMVDPMHPEGAVWLKADS